MTLTELKKSLLKMTLTELMKALTDLNLAELKEFLEFERNEYEQTLDQLPPVQYSLFCKLPPNRRDVKCSNQRAWELVKIMEHLRDADRIILKAIWNYPVSY